MFVGIDYASEPDRIGLRTAVKLDIGQRISFPQPNSHRTIVIKQLAECDYEVKTFIRPSRGYAKHVRRLKCNPA